MCRMSPPPSTPTSRASGIRSHQLATTPVAAGARRSSIRLTPPRPVPCGFESPGSVMAPPSALLGINQRGGSMPGCRRFSWIAAILVGLIGSIVGFGPIEAATAVGGNAHSGQLAGGSAVVPPPKPPGGNSPPARQGQQQGPKEKPRPAQPTEPVTQPVAKTGRRKGRTDQVQGAAEAVPSAAMAAEMGNGESAPSVTDAAVPPTVATEPNGLRVERAQASQFPESAEEVGASDTDAVLLERWRAYGGEAAFESLVARYLPFLLNYARRFVDEDSAKDSVPLAFECLCSQPIQVKDAAHLRARLRRVVRGYAVDHVRKHGRLVLKDPYWFDGQVQTPQPEGSCQRLEQLEAAMAMLRPGEPEVLLWRYGEDLGCVEIAARLAVPLRSVQRKVAVARRRLQAAMKIVEKSWRVLASSND
jgi:RNA polymerase sigma factor (sigma-70 family)